MAKETKSKTKKSTKVLKPEVKKLAVVRVKGRQYLVKTGDELLIDKSDVKDINFEVLLLIEDDKVTVGKSVVKDVKVSYKILAEEEKGKKIKVFKYKAKSRYRKHLGFRPKYTRLLIEKIS